MADVIDSTTGVGTTAGTGTAAAPETLLTVSHQNGKALNFVELKNRDTAKFLAAKDAQDPGSYQIAGPGEAITIAAGNPLTNSLTKIVGFGFTSIVNMTTGEAIVVTVGSKKRA